MKRIATALVLLPLAVGVVFAGPQWEWAFKAFLAAVGLIAFYEYDHIVAAQGIARAGCPGMAAGLVLLLAPEPFVVASVVTLAGMTVALRIADLEGMLKSAAAFVLGVLYIFGAWRCAIGLREINPHWLMIALLVSWVGDTAAMYVGKAFGRHKLAPHISPGKTWEGSMGSVVGGTLAAAVYAHYLIGPAPLVGVIAVAAAANVAGQTGDLCESALKRGAGLKDSGSSLPGHGGWLDRIDSSLFSIPVVYAALKFLLR
jgi:phosphatidate cytidylyltransferase